MGAPQQQPDEDGVRGPERGQHARGRRVDAEDGTDEDERSDQQRVCQVEAGNRSMGGMGKLHGSKESVKHASGQISTVPYGNNLF
jgi:hypothetical protein